MAEPGAERRDRIVELLLRLHPAQFRERYADAVHETHRMRAAEARIAGRQAHAAFLVREYVGLSVSAWRERANGRAVSRGAAGRAPRRREGVMVRLQDSLHELVSAGRRLARAPLFTAASVLMLGLGMGASMAVYALIRGVLLKPLPYALPDRLVWLDHGAPGYGFDSGLGIAVWQYVQYGESSQLLSGLALAQPGVVTLVEDASEPERLTSATVTPSMARVMGVTPVLGRWFDDATARDVLVSYGLWQRRWGGDAGLPGRVIRLSDVDYRVIGVMPKGFAIPDAETDLWTVREYDRAWGDGSFSYFAVGRMKDGVTLEALRSELQSLTGRAAEEFGEHLQVARRVVEGRVQATPVSLEAHVTGAVRGTLWMLFGAVLLVLLTAWANVANLFVVRADARRREVSVRRAIGAGRSAIVSYFMAEGALLAIASWLAGTALAWLTVRAITGFAPLDLPRSDDIALDAHVLLWAFGLVAVVALGLTAIPLGQGSGASSVLREDSRTTTASRARLRLRGALMAMQVGLALMLLAASGLLVKSWMNVRSRSPGFNADEALFFDVALSPRTYTNRAEAALFHRLVAERIGALPGVTSVAYGTTLPLDGFSFGEGVVPEGGTDADRVIVSLRRVSAGYFDALELPLIAGETFGPTDGPAEASVILSRETATRLFPGGSAVGRRITVGSGTPAWRIIGVAADAATRSVMESRPEQIVYLPIRDPSDGSVNLNRMSFIVRAGRDPARFVTAIRAVVHDVGPETAVARVRTLGMVLAADRSQIALATVLLGTAAGVAVLLGAFGIYAVFAWVVGRRTSELGLRLALGARAGHVLGLVFRQAGVVTLIGFTIGLAGAALLTRSLTSLLFGVTPLDATVFAGASFVILTIALAAAFVPARRAWRLRPTEALRTE